jgi:uncharacterized protein (TIGR03000 family)
LYGGYHSGYFHSYPHGFYGGYYPYYYPSYNYWYTPSYTYDSGWSTPDISGYYNPDQVVNYPPASPLPTASAHITVRVPENAEIWFGDRKTTTPGAVRDFESPPLEPGKTYTYDVKARWMEDGREVTQTQKVPVTAGANANVTFPMPAENSGQTAPPPR